MTLMESPEARRVVDHNFAIRQKLQLIFLQSVHSEGNLEDPSLRKSLDNSSRIFESVFDKVLEEHPSFYADAEENFDGALALIKAKYEEMMGAAKAK